MDTDRNITINGREYSFVEGETIYEVATRNGIYIPTLCHLKGTTPTGACRVCVVEVEGARYLAASCVMPASNNMVVLTDSQKVVEARRFIIALLMTSGNHNCTARGNTEVDWTDFQLDVRDYDQSTSICDKYGVCKLQELAYKYQVSDLLQFGEIETEYPIEMDNPFIIRDFSRCILCGRCVKACNEVQVNNAIAIGYRGVEAKIVTASDVPLADSDCVLCGECVQVCPVGALVEKNNRFIARPWDLERVQTTCTYCGTGCSIDLFVKEGKVVKVGGTEDGVANKGSLCVKGRYGNDFIHHPDRLTDPLIRDGNDLKKVGWDEALDFVSKKLTEIKEKHGPDSIAGLSSARCTNEDNYIMQKFLRAVIGTNNVDHCARL